MEPYLSIYIKKENRLSIQYFNKDGNKFIEVNDTMIAENLSTCLRDLCVLYLMKRDFMIGANIYIEQPGMYMTDIYNFGKEMQSIDPESKLNINLLPIMVDLGGEF